MKPEFVEMLSALSAAGAEFLVVGAHPSRLKRPRRLQMELGGVRFGVLSREDLITNERSTGRPRDILDLDSLG